MWTLLFIKRQPEILKKVLLFGYLLVCSVCVSFFASNINISLTYLVRGPLQVLFLRVLTLKNVIALT